MRWRVRDSWLAGVVILFVCRLSLAPAFTADTGPWAHRKPVDGEAGRLDGAPGWNVGDRWTYRVSSIGISQKTAERRIAVTVHPGDLVLEERVRRLQEM